MYKIGDTIVYSDGKIYSIVDKLERDYGRGPQMYFELKQNDLLLKQQDPNDDNDDENADDINNDDKENAGKNDNEDENK